MRAIGRALKSYDPGSPERQDEIDYLAEQSEQYDPRTSHLPEISLDKETLLPEVGINRMAELAAQEVDRLTRERFPGVSEDLLAEVRAQVKHSVTAKEGAKRPAESSEVRLTQRDDPELLPEMLAAPQGIPTSQQVPQHEVVLTPLAEPSSLSEPIMNGQPLPTIQGDLLGIEIPAPQSISVAASQSPVFQLSPHDSLEDFSVTSRSRDQLRYEAAKIRNTA